MIETTLTPLICPRFLHEEKYRQGHIRIINALPGRRILGLHLPEMKQMAKELSRQADAPDMLHAFEREHEADRFRLTYEETLIWGLTINALKCRGRTPFAPDAIHPRTRQLGGVRLLLLQCQVGAESAFANLVGIPVALLPERQGV